MGIGGAIQWRERQNVVRSVGVVAAGAPLQLAASGSQDGRTGYRRFRQIMLIFWCLFAFMGMGLEQSIANQSLLGLSLFLPHEACATWGGFWCNQGFVVFGNIVGGGICVGGLYWPVTPYRAQCREQAFCRTRSRQRPPDVGESAMADLMTYGERSRRE